jgi:hypothetical protein
MSRRKQTNPRAIKRDGKLIFLYINISISSLIFFIYSVSQDDDETSIPIAKSKYFSNKKKEELFLLYNFIYF